MKHKYILAISACGALGITVMRALQLKSLIDGATGFGKPGSGLNSAIYILTALIVAAILIISGFFSKRQPARSPNMRLSPGLAVMNLVLVVYHFYEIGTFVINNQNLTSTFSLVYMLFLLLAIAFHTLYGISALSESIKVPKILSLAPILLAGYKLVETFIGSIGVSLISDNVYECLFLCIVLFFFLQHGKIIAGIEIRRSARIMLPTALLVFALGCVTSLAPILALCTGAKLHSNINGDIFLALYALFFMLALYKKKD